MFTRASITCASFSSALCINTKYSLFAANKKQATTNCSSITHIFLLQVCAASLFVSARRLAAAYIVSFSSPTVPDFSSSVFEATTPLLLVLNTAVS